MYYTIYKVTNKINGKFYIGSHKTKNLDDGYMGSGKYVQRAQIKYGLENFKKEILYVFHTPEQMYAKEAEIVTEDFIAEENTYNIKEGGFGGWDYVNSNSLNYTLEKNKRISPFKDKEFYKRYKQDHLDGSKKGLAKIKEMRDCGKIAPSFKGRKHTDQTKQTLSTKAKQRLIDPTNNSQYGTMWITNGTINKKIKKDSTIPEGWKKGRILAR